MRVSFPSPPSASPQGTRNRTHLVALGRAIAPDGDTFSVVVRDGRRPASLDVPQLRGAPPAPLDDSRTVRRVAHPAPRYAERLVRGPANELNVAWGAVGPRGEHEQSPVIRGTVPGVGEDERRTWCRTGVGDTKGEAASCCERGTLTVSVVLSAYARMKTDRGW